MKKIYIKGKTEEICRGIAAALDEFDAEITFGFSGSDPQDMTGFDAALVSTPLQSEFGLNYVAQLRKKTDACIIVITRSDIVDEVQSRIKFTGAFVLARPFSKSTLVQTIRMALLAKENIMRLEQEKSELSRQLDDSKVISRAKCCLIEYLNLTEKQAHRHIQKLAMDTGKSPREIAEDILHTYSGMTNV